jgi:hypothetical protein
MRILKARALDALLGELVTRDRVDVAIMGGAAAVSLAIDGNVGASEEWRCLEALRFDGDVDVWIAPTAGLGRPLSADEESEARERVSSALSECGYAHVPSGMTDRDRYEERLGLGGGIVGSNLQFVPRPLARSWIGPTFVPSDPRHVVQVMTVRVPLRAVAERFDLTCCAAIAQLVGSTLQLQRVLPSGLEGGERGAMGVAVTPHVAAAIAELDDAAAAVALARLESRVSRYWARGFVFGDWRAQLADARAANASMTAVVRGVERLRV